MFIHRCLFMHIYFCREICGINKGARHNKRREIKRYKINYNDYVICNNIYLKYMSHNESAFLPKCFI